jgi:hypothetical protein
VTAGEWAKDAFWWVAVTVFLNRYSGRVPRRCATGLRLRRPPQLRKVNLSLASRRLTAFEVITNGFVHCRKQVNCTAA